MSLNLIKKFKGLHLSILVVFFMSASCASAAEFVVGGVRMSKNLKPLRDLKRKNVVTQSLDYSCGPAGLSTLLNFYLNDPVSETEIIERLLQVIPLEKVKQRRGFSLYDLKIYAKEKGYKVTGYKMDMDFLKDLNKPVLVPIRFKNYRHFVVVKGIISDRVFIADPAAGNMSMTESQFKKNWISGIGLVVENKDPENNPDKYALNVTKENIVVADYRNIRRLMTQGIARTMIHPDEW